MATALNGRTVTLRGLMGRQHAQLHRDAERLARLVEDLVELSEGATRRGRQDVGPIVLSEVVVGAMAVARTHADRRGVTLTDRVGELPEVELGTGELTSALRELLDDAIRHSSAGATVLVESFVDPGGVTLAVTDECGGPHERDLTRVFDVAYRAEVAQRRDGGVPLAVPAGTVGAHPGRIEEANGSPGCCFTVRLGHPA